MKKLLALLVVTVILTGSAVAYGAAQNHKARAVTVGHVGRTNKAGSGPSLRPVKMANVGSLQNARRTRNCGSELKAATLMCLNTQIKYLAKHVDRTDALFAAMLSCLGVGPVNQYFGYVYTDGVTLWPETALDFQEQGDTLPPDVLMLGWLCDTGS